MEHRFADFAARSGLDFGLPPELLERIGQATRDGLPLDTLLDREAASGAQPVHLLELRRAWHRFASLASEAGALALPTLSALAMRAARFGASAGRDEAERRALAGALGAYASACLETGRLRFRGTRPGASLPDEVAALLERSEGCAELPPHHWFAARRAEQDGLLELELVAPDGEAERALGTLHTPERAAALARAGAAAVRAELHARAEQRALETAALGLHALLSRAPLSCPVAGVACDGKRVWVHVEADPPLEEPARELGARDLRGLLGFLADRGARHVGLAAARRGVDVTGLLRALSEAGLPAERAREAGLMKQARGRLAEAARVVALRLRDPLVGHEGLGADELGLGEYLDQVDAGRLRAALEDVRAAVSWERRQGLGGRPRPRGLEPAPRPLHPMVQGLGDLRPGMELAGTVANLTDFGAFIELGLPIQGLVHLSELSAQFVSHPSEVVQVGQRVRARVLEVDLDAGRLALSLRPPRDPRRRKQGTQARTQALDSLDKLFKK